jgi:molybdate transport system substrate-binding protein
MLQAFEQLGIAEAMKAKTVAFKVRSDRFGAIARGDVEIGFNQISEIVAAPGVDLAGPLPAAIQNFTLLSTAIIASSSEKEAARSLIQFITSSRARELMRAKGFEDP